MSVIYYEFGTGLPMKFVKLNTICLNKRYINASTDEHLCDTFPIHNNLEARDSLSLLLSFLLLNISWKEGLKLNGASRILICV